MPTTTLGKWSVGLHVFFLIVISISIFLVQGVQVLRFEDRWWDVTVPIAFSASIAALITGIIAKRRYRDQSRTVLLSVLLGTAVILFIIFHSLFIND